MKPFTLKRSLVGVVLTVALSFSACGEDGQRSTGATTQETVQSSVSPTTIQPVETSAAVRSGRSLITTTSAPSAAATDLARELIPEATASYDFDQVSINGVQYSNALRISAFTTPQKVEINAGRAHDKFLGVLGIPDDQKSASMVQVDIGLDNAAPIFSTVVSFGESKNIDIDVPAVLRIKITVTSKTSSSAYVAIANPRLA